MAARPLLLSSTSDLRNVAEIRYEWDNEQLGPGVLPQVSLEERFCRETHRRSIETENCLPNTVVEEARSGAIRAILDSNLDHQVHTPEMAQMMFGLTRPYYRRDHNISRLIDLACVEFGTVFLRTSLPNMSSKTMLPAIQLLRSRGFRQRPWKQLCHVYTPNDFSILGQVFFDITKLPFSFGPKKKYVMAIADSSHLKELTALRHSLAKELDYRTHHELVEMSVHNLIELQNTRKGISSLLVMLQDAKVVGSVRVTPRYNVWHGMMQLEIRDIILLKSHRKHNLLPWIFYAALVGGRTLIHPDDNRPPLRVETWLYSDILVNHYKKGTTFAVRNRRTVL